MGRRIVVMKPIFSLGHCECDGHTVHKLSQRRLTAELLAPRDSNCIRMHSKVSSDWLPSYIKATSPVLEIFKMVGFFPDSHRLQTTTAFGVLIAGHLQDREADYINNTVFGNTDGDKKERIKVAQRSFNE